MTPEAASLHSFGDQRLFDGVTRSILDAALDCIVVMGADGRVVEWNPAAEQTFGYSRDEAVGSELGELIVPPELREAHRRGVARHLKTGIEHVIGRRLELEAMRADGSRLPVELAITRLDRHPPLFVGYLRDITQRRSSAHAVEEAERRYRTLVERLPVVTYSAELGPAGRWTYVSPQIEHMTGYSAEEWMADPELWFRRLHPSDRDDVVRAEARVEREGGRLDIEYRLLARNGDIVWVRDEATSTPGRPGESGLVEGVLVDITEQRLAAESLRYHADHDVLTGLVNRRRFEEELERCGSDPACARGAVVIVDVDHFKFVNDSLGHEAGDAVLRGVASSLREHAGPTGLPARLGGDEFAVLLPGAGEQEARDLALTLLQAVRTRETRVPVTASAGISVFDAGPAHDLADALVAADIALYEAKEGGRDRVATFTGQQGQRLTWIGRIRRAVEEGRLALYSQPIVDLATGATAGEELLVRMLDESGELVMPSAFLPTAERFGVIRDIDRWVVSRALELTAAGRPVSVNLSARSVSDPELTTRVEQGLRRGGADPALLTFEITETAAAADMEDVRAFAERVQRIGCHLALDDFGTGFGSFIYLKHLPVSELKIDMEFVRNVSRSAADRRLVDSIVTIARGLGIRTVAEGVEDEATLRLLRNYGVDRAQGWQLGPPAPVEQ
ncbi:MAG TPA: EAL domain-containing protein [Thermoleophilaceae bacterium]|nr:EAL domain-containing protein [Thermoleophilaceae bacterium]